MKVGNSGKKINVIEATPISGSEERMSSPGQEGVAAHGLHDRVSISDKAREYNRVAQMFHEEEEVMAKNRVEELKEKVRSGKYKVSSRDVARAFLSHVYNK